MKILKHQKALSRLLQIAGSYWFLKQSKVPYAPYRIWIEPTNRCNLACTMCPNKDFKKDELGDLDVGLFQSIIDQCKYYVHDINLHHRGEPLLHPKLEDMIYYANNNGVKVKLHTNATLLTEKRSHQLIESGLRLISFSFDGYSARDYEEIRRGAKFERTLANIHRFLEIKREWGKSEPRTVMEVMEFKDRTIDPEQKERFIKALKQRGLDKLIIKTPHNWAGNIDAVDFQKTSFSACTFPWQALVVLWDGRVGSCPHDFFAKIIYGDAKKEDVEDIFNCEVIQKLREQMLKSSLSELDSPCRECDSVRRKKIIGIPLESIKYLRD